MFLIVAALVSNWCDAQTILSGSELFGKDRKNGFYMTLSIEDKYLEKDWPTFLSRFGNVSQTKETYTIPAASIPDLTSEPVTVTSKIISEQRGKTKIFASFEIGGVAVSQELDGYAAVEKLMKDFYTYAMQYEDVRLAEKDAGESQKNYDRVKKTGSRIARDIERNKREKESLLKKIEDNKLELEKLLQEQTANLQDLENAKIAIEEKQKSLNTVKNRKP